MLQYFDKDFFKFLIGFISIVIISLVIIAVFRQLQTGSRIESAPAVYTATPQT